MIKIENKYYCVFCGRRKRCENSYYNNGRIGICPDCFSRLNFTPDPHVFQGTRNIDYLVSPIFYSDKIRDIIIDYKFNGYYAYADILSYLLCDLLKNMEHLSGFDYVIPVPLSKKRFTERGYNQAALIAEPLANYFNVPYSEDILLKTKETKRQSRISRAERFTNVKDAFEVFRDLTNKRILLADDIFTTGSTMSACTDALKQRGARNVVGISLTFREKLENIFNLMY